MDGLTRQARDSLQEFGGFMREGRRVAVTLNRIWRNWRLIPRAFCLVEINSRNTLPREDNTLEGQRGVSLEPGAIGHVAICASARCGLALPGPIRLRLGGL